MFIRRYEMPWRHAYEAYAGLVWGLALVFFMVVGVLGQVPRALALPLSLTCFGMAALRVSQALRILILRASLSGHGIQVKGVTPLLVATDGVPLRKNSGIAVERRGKDPGFRGKRGRRVLAGVVRDTNVIVDAVKTERLPNLARREGRTVL